MPSSIRSGVEVGKYSRSASRKWSFTEKRNNSHAKVQTLHAACGDGDPIRGDRKSLVGLQFDDLLDEAGLAFAGAICITFPVATRRAA
jgi:hypothetical protein